MQEVNKYVVPQWYNDAKIGLMINWGVYSYPAYAPKYEKSFSNLLVEEGLEVLADNPNSEWYFNSMTVSGSQTEQYHNENHAGGSYEDFAKEFDNRAKNLLVKDWVDLFKLSGAKYVVMAAKQHDGFCMWPTDTPQKENWSAGRDYLGDLNRSLKDTGIKFGIYYASGMDWSFLHTPIDSMHSYISNMDSEQDYSDYVVKQLKELIQRYNPAILWNDAGFPVHADLEDLLSYYFENVKDGVINDRWGQRTFPENTLGKIMLKIAAKTAESKVREQGMLNIDESAIHTFTSVEDLGYTQKVEEKWELMKTPFKSRAYNKNVELNEIDDAASLIEELAKTVSNNGNMIINIGPKADGTIPDYQAETLKQLGSWLETNGEAIYGTKPWKQISGETAQRIKAYFTQKDGCVYAVVMGNPRTKTITIQDFSVSADTKVYMLGSDIPLPWSPKIGHVQVYLPDDRIEQSALCLKFVGKTIDLKTEK